jgi:hypothetical protein
MGFYEYLEVRCLPALRSKFRYELIKSFLYQTKDGDTITVPKGFKTDFASVPWFFQRIIPKTGRYNEATVIHDYLCYTAIDKHDRKYADRIFLECMEVLGVSKWKRKAMYRGVSLYTFFKRSK